jgi:hypothetical protein
MRTLVGVLSLAAALTTVGAIARQGLQINSGPVVGWRCPDCDCGNAGDPEARFRAVCRGCGVAYPWDVALRTTVEADAFAR